MKIELRAIQESDAEVVYEMFQSISGENGFGNTSYGLSKTEFIDWIKKQIDNSNGINLSSGRVPQTIFVLWINDEPVGFSKLRHYLTPELENYAGHIGRSISSKFRGKGYGNILLAETLKQAKAMGIKKIRISNDDDNISAWKSVERNGGVLDRISDSSERGKSIRLYWIKL
jgi:predicted acetyltransferase